MFSSRCSLFSINTFLVFCSLALWLHKLIWNWVCLFTYFPSLNTCVCCSFTGHNKNKCSLHLSASVDIHHSSKLSVCLCLSLSPSTTQTKRSFQAFAVCRPVSSDWLVYILCGSKYMCMFSQCFLSLGTTKQALLSWTWQLPLKLMSPSGGGE